MPRNSKSPPTYARHSSGQARVRVDGRVVYLGRYGSPESKAKYAAIIARWSAERESGKTAELTNDQLALAFLHYCEATFRKDGKPTAYVDKVRAGLRYVVRDYGTQQAAEFSPRKLKRLRDHMIADGRSRRYINDLARVITRAFRWAASEELVDPGVPVGLATVEGLRKDRSKAREPESIHPVAADHVDAVLPHVSCQIAAVVQLQQLTGMRPSEVLILRLVSNSRSS